MFRAKPELSKEISIVLQINITLLRKGLVLLSTWRKNENILLVSSFSID